MSKKNMNIITLGKDNIEKEHICCAFGGKNQNGIDLKKTWLKERFDEGLKFKKLDVKGKVFIEYIPAEYAWRPIEACGYLFIHCLWVSGRYKGQGHANQLLNECIADAKGKNGIVVITSKQPFLTDKGFFLKKGFEICDTAPPYFELLVKKLKADAPTPKFKDKAKTLTISNKNGLIFYFSDQCPYNSGFWLNEMIEVAKERDIPFHNQKITTAKEAQEQACSFGTFGVYYNGNLLTHGPATKKQFEKLLDKTMK